MYALSVLFEVFPDRIEEFKKAAIAHADNSRTNEKGCLGFTVFQSEDRDEEFYFHEVYESRAALEEVHAKQPYFAAFGETTTPWIKDKQIRRWVMAELGESQ